MLKGAQFKFRDVERPTLEILPSTFTSNADGSVSFATLKDFLDATKDRDLKLTVMIYTEFVEEFANVYEQLTAQHEIINYIHR